MYHLRSLDREYTHLIFLSKSFLAINLLLTGDNRKMINQITA